MLLSSVEQWAADVFDLGFIVAAGLLGVEIVRDMVTSRLSKRRLLETLASLSTQIPFYAAEALTFGLVVAGYYAIFYFVAPLHIPVTPWTVVLAVLAADFVYYWEHRASHRIRLLWVAHAVHHSSPILNSSVAFRFSAFDPLISAESHLPLILLGFDPILVFFGQLVVLSYQTWIHTEVIGRLGPLDAVVNTPSNHRVHHGSDRKYVDRNYGGILMVWDRLFGTYQPEEETPVYGIKPAINTVNPIKVWFSEIPSLFRDLTSASSHEQILGYLFRYPGWKPRSEPANSTRRES